MADSVTIDGTDYRVIEDSLPEGELKLEKESLHERADELARKVEQAIEETQAFIDSLPVFEPRSDRSENVNELLNMEI